MNSFYTLLGMLLIRLQSTVVVGSQVAENVERLIAVTRFDYIFDFYRRMKFEEPHDEVESALDPDSKKRICHHVTTSGFFRRRLEIPVDFDSVYLEIESLAEHDYDFEVLAREYYQKTVFKINPAPPPVGLSFRVNFRAYSHPTKAIRVTDGLHRTTESAFACLTRDRYENKSPPNIYFISEVYNVQRDTSSNEYAAARFVFQSFHPRVELIALAEEPAVSFSNADYNVEELYLRLRYTYESSQRESSDPLCGLEKFEKIRVCASVLNSSYFEGIVEHLPYEDPDRFKEGCRKRKVSFHSEAAKLESAGMLYDEWMLPCEVEPIVDDAAFVYYVSRAYSPHFVFVYKRHHSTREWLLVNVSKVIGVFIDDCVNPPCVSMQSLLEEFRIPRENTPSSSEVGPLLFNASPNIIVA